MTGLADPGSGGDALMAVPPHALPEPSPPPSGLPAPVPCTAAGTPVPAGDGAGRPSPAGRHDSDAERAAQREAWGRLRASYARGRRGGPARYWRRAARGQLPNGPGMIRRPPSGGDDAA